MFLSLDLETKESLSGVGDGDVNHLITKMEWHFTGPHKCTRRCIDFKYLLHLLKLKEKPSAEKRTQTEEILLKTQPELKSLLLRVLNFLVIK